MALEPSGYSAALRHYTAYGICRQLARHFDQLEVECWVLSMTAIGAALVDFIRPMRGSAPAHQHENLLRSMLFGGIGSQPVAEFIKRFADQLPETYRADLLAMAKNEPLEQVVAYMES